MKKILIAVLLSFTFITLTAFNTNQNIIFPAEGTITSVYTTDTHVYFSAQLSNDKWVVYGYNLSNGELDYETPSYNNSIIDIQATDTHIYFVESGRMFVRTYNKETQSTGNVWQNYNNDVTVVAVNDTHVFYGGPTLWGYNINDGTVDINIPSYFSTIRAVYITDTHVFYGGAGSKNVRGYNLETGTVDIQTPNYSGNIRDIVVTDTHIFYGGDTQTVRGYNLETGTVDIETPSYGGTIMGIAVNDTHIFYGGNDTNRVLGYNLETGTVDIETPLYNGNIRDVALNDTHVFYGGNDVHQLHGYLYIGLPPISNTLFDTVNAIAVSIMSMFASLFATMTNVFYDEGFTTFGLIIMIPVGFVLGTFALVKIRSMMMMKG